MPDFQRKRPAWVGFLVGMLAIVVPLGGLLLWRQARERTRLRPPAADLRTPPPASIPRGPAAGGEPVDGAGLVASGASIEDATPPPAGPVLRAACARARDWLESVHVDPFGGSGVDSLRLFALEVESWDRLAAAEPPGAEKSRLENGVRERLRRVCDADRLRGRLGAQGSAAGLLECMQLAARCRAYGVDPAPLVRAVASCRPILDREIDRLPPSMAMLYDAAMEQSGVGSRPSPAGAARSGILAARPREVAMATGEIAGLTSEIFAATDGARRPLTGLSPEDGAWLHRVLPYFAMAMTVFQNDERAADLLSCMCAAGMTETYGYREGLRRLVERQNPDGSFGQANAPGGRARVIQLLAPTTAAVTAISLERLRIGTAG
jgi:hypothetical protein